MKLPLSIIVHTRNEAACVRECLQGLRGWAEEVLLCDMESSDGTALLAEPLITQLLVVPFSAEFDAARNISASKASQPWILYLDADERLTEDIKVTIAELIHSADDSVGGFQLPFKTISFGSWIQHAGNWWPSYKSPPLLRKGRFSFSGKVHDPARVDGHVVRVAPRNERDAIDHFSHRDFTHYLEKLNRYTSLEIEKHTGGGSWEAAARRMGQTFRWFYDETSGKNDGLAGFLLSAGSAFYEAAIQLKLMERGQVQDIPPSAEAFFQLAMDAARVAPNVPEPPSLDGVAPDATLSTTGGKVPIYESSWRALYLDWETSAETCRQISAVTHANALRILGGGEVQLIETTRALYERGVASTVGVGLVPSAGDLVHVYSLHTPELLDELRVADRPYVLTPIYWDRSELAWIHHRLQTVVATSETISALLSGFVVLKTMADEARASGRFVQTLPDEVCDLILGATYILPNAKCEAAELERSVGGAIPPVRIIPNAVREADSFVPVEGLPSEPFILCVGRIETNKNQLVLSLACRLANIPLVLIGAEVDPNYAAMCRMVGGDNTRFLGPRGRSEVAWTMQRAAAHCLPSFAETPGLANLEAAQLGCPLVCSNRGAEQEYFGDYACYVDPLDPEAIAATLSKVVSGERPKGTFSSKSWDYVAKSLIDAYTEVFEASGRSS